MKRRCYNSKDRKYKNYGAKEIKICNEWLNDFKKFYDWSMENGYQERLTIDRIDVNGNYEPSNCRWVNQKIQQNNRTNNHEITFKGKTQNLSQWAIELNISYDCLERRINKLKWSIEEAFTIPSRKGNNQNTRRII